jgi:hypothetical protein
VSDLKVIRFPNASVIEDLNAVRSSILQECTARSRSSPLPG